MTDVPRDFTLDCGCFFAFTVVDSINTLTVSPCTPQYTNLQTSLRVAAEEGKPVQFREGS